MPINEVITGNEESATVNPSDVESDVIVEGTGKGTIWLQARIPGQKWQDITNQTGAYPVRTFDPTLEYRFKASGVMEGTRVYMS